MQPGSALFRAKWTAKEIYIHTRAFGVAAGTRYASMRVRELRHRRAKPWTGGGPVPAGVTATVLIGPGLQDLLAWQAPVLQAGPERRAAHALIPLARTVVFSGSALPRDLSALLRMCRDYSVSVVYVYSTRTLWRDRRDHHRLLNAAHTAVCTVGGER